MSPPEKTLEISLLHFDSEIPSLDEISEKLDLYRKIPVDVLNWKEYDYKPVVLFSMAYTANEILLKYYVTEEYFKAEKTESNQEVYEDSCVEFFISPAVDGIYYNLEFNGIGTCLMGYGNGRSDRKRADASLIAQIRRTTSAGNEMIRERKGPFSWEITTAIPFSVFFRHDIRTFQGKTVRANFYKCGDKLTVPHYVTWAPVMTARPDYHRPEFFGHIKFI